MKSSKFSIRPGLLFRKLTQESHSTKAVNVDLQTRINSGIRNYFYGISVEGQVVQRKLWLGIWPEGDIEFASKVIQKGNILSFVDMEFSIDKDNFWSQSIFSRLVVSQFWTFNAIFREKVIARINELTYEEAFVYYKELDSNFYPYHSAPVIRGGEYEWARIVKYPNASRLESLKGVFQLDYKNRLAIKIVLKSRCLRLLRFKKTPITQTPSDKLNEGPINCLPDTAEMKSEGIKKSTRVSFMEMLKPVDSDPKNTLEIIHCSLELAKAPRNIFSPPVFTRNEKKPKGFNGTIGAMVAFFFESNFFKEHYSKEDIIEAFLADYNIIIPKYKGTFNFFYDDYYYNDLVKRLKKLKISKL